MRRSDLKNAWTQLLGTVRLVLTLIGSAHATMVWAREDRVPGSRYTSARIAATADAALSLADDAASALFYQPAGIGKFTKFRFDPVNLAFGMPQGTFSMLGVDFYKMASLDAIASKVAQNSGSWGGVNSQIAPVFSMPFFAFGILLSTENSARDDGGVLRYRSRYQLIPAVGTGVSLAHGVIRLGYSLQWVNTSFGEVTAPAQPYSYRTNLVEGGAFSHTLGFAFTLPYTYLPMLNIVYRNVARARYSSLMLFRFASSPTGLPADEPASFDATLSMTPRIAGNSFLTWSIGLRDAFNASGTSTLTRAVFGLEIDIKKSFYLRGGFGSGYPSAGFGYRGERSDFGIAWYAEELQSGFRQEELRKILLQFQYRAF